jgi:hypothetical protein
MPLKGITSSLKRAGSLTTATLRLSDAIMKAEKEIAQYKKRRLHDGITTIKAGAGTTKNKTIIIERKTIQSIINKPHFDYLKTF